MTAERIKPTIGIITALPEEYTAVKAMLKNVRSYQMKGPSYSRQCLLGEIPALNGEKHTLVLLLANKGNNIAASRATLLLEHFSNVKSVIMVGIAGGVPHPKNPDEHVRLGDVIVSDQGGVIQYDFVKEQSAEIAYGHLPRPPNPRLLDAVRLLEATKMEGKRPWVKFINQAMQRLHIVRPPRETDILIGSTDQKKKVSHPRDLKRVDGEPRVFIGPVASANTLLKNPLKRDLLRDEFGVKAVEMEGSGIADATWDHEVGYLVVRGICDYCDSSKNDIWHNYAAIVAAAYTRALLEQTPSQVLQTEIKGSRLQESTSSINTGKMHIEIAQKGNQESGRQPFNLDEILIICRNQVTKEIKHLKGSSEERRKKYIPDLYVARTEIENEFEEFLKQQDKNACVVVGEAGIGKTNLLCHLSEKLVEDRPALFLNSMYINKPLEDYIMSFFQEISIPHGDFGELINELNAILNERDLDLVFFLDAINESPDPSKIKSELANLVQKNIGNRVKFYISCRDMDWEFFLKNNDMFMDCLYSKKGRVFLKNDLRFDEFSKKEFNTAWKLYRRMYGLKGTLGRELGDICMHPLMLRFLAEGFEGKNLPEDVRRIEIFDQYWLRKLEHTGREDRATEYMFKIVGELKKRQKNELLKTEIVTLLGDTTDDLQTVLSKILSENLVTYLNWAGVRVVGFAYEAFFEYVMARWIMYGCEYSWAQKTRDGIAVDLAKFVEESKRYRTMKGTIQYLVMMMEGRKNDIHVSILNELLKTEEPTWESFVINISRKLKDPKEVLHIIGKLATKSDLKVFAVRVLGDIGGDESVEYLAEALRDDDSEVWNEAIGSLTKVGSKKALQSLANALRDMNGLSLRYNVMKALSRVKDRDITTDLLKMAKEVDAYTKKYIIEIFGESWDDRTIEFLLDALEDGDEEIAASAAEALGKIMSSSETSWKTWNDSVTDALIKLLDRQSDWVRINAADTLGMTGNRKAIKPLLRLLADEVRHVRRSAIEALGMIGGEDIVSPIVDLLDEEDEFVRKNAIIALGMIGSNKAIPSLLDALCTKKMKNRRCIYDAFAAVGVDVSLHALLNVLKKENCLRMPYIIEAIGSLKSVSGIGPLQSFFNDHPGEFEEEIVEAFENIGGESVTQILLSMLHGTNERLRLLAIDALGRMKMEEAIESLTNFVKVSKEETRVHSIIALGKIGNPNTTDTLVCAMNTKNGRIRCAAATALGTIGGERVVGPLISALDDSKEEVRIAAVDSLGELKSGRAVAPLLKLLYTEHKYDVKVSVARALGEIGNAIVVSPLLGILKSKTKVKVRENWRNEPIMEKPSRLWKETITALGKIGSTNATETLVRLLEEYRPPQDRNWNELDDYRLEAVEALGRIGDNLAVTTLIDLLKRRLTTYSGPNADLRNRLESRIRKTARDALMTITEKESRI
jgi:HEAT repeat protein/nucleoside phosphorylase